ncbi:2-phospho-L-lactate guanylyltransferase [Novosphingobium aquimarinum]|uniref:2-phospho-L-lactate guanylyltransferase n=1 Tax=Novosphingobium aquimarinum TaxID=2682494 RepID=UPI001E470DC7|nr:2-phospho-L-lactate guanylyltransferase [Novosphingobium aquimarinum]
MNAQAGSCIALIPAKPLLHAKSRLAGVLDRSSRERLVEAMLEHVIATALSAGTVDAVLTVGRRSPAYPLLDVIADAGVGLNAALCHSLPLVAQRGATRMLVIAGDLPSLDTGNIDLLAQLDTDTIGIAPDRHGTGTNALSLPLPAGEDFRFAYGSNSFAHHREEARRLGYDARVILGDGLANDIDDPADLAGGAV